MFDAIATLLAAIDHQRAGRLAQAESLLRLVLAHDADEPSALFLLGSTVLALGRPEEAAVMLSHAVSIRPHHREQRQALARALIKAGDAARALEALAPLAEDLGLAEVQFLLGTALNAMKRPAEAAAVLQHAVAANPDHAEAHLNLGNALADLNDATGAERHIRRAVALDPALAEAHASLGYVLTVQGDLCGAISACQRAIDLRPDFALAHWNQGIAYLLDGRMTEGFEQYEWRKRHFPHQFAAPPGSQWDGSPLAGRTLLVVAEQGFGDTIQLCRYLPPLALQGGVKLECAPCLLALMRCLPGVMVHATGSPRPAYDLWADQMSLPRLLGTTLQTVPSQRAYLRADPARAAAMRMRPRPQLRIGLVWAGNPGHSNDHRRSVAARELAPLLAEAPGAFISLQVGAAAAQAPSLGMADDPPTLRDFADTAALVAELDLVVTVDTAVAHLAGALGVPTWVMLPHAPDWRWMLLRDDTPWYSAMRLFRQDRPGDWTGVIERVAACLRHLVARQTIAMPPLTCKVEPVTHAASVEAK